MPAKDKYHDALRAALVKDGWTITDDPYRLVWGKRDFYVDLGAERLVAAEKAGRCIAVEIKSFLGPNRALFLAIPDTATDVFDEPVGLLLIAKHLVQAVVFDVEKAEVLRWIP